MKKTKNQKPKTKNYLEEKARKVKLLLLDVDGVLTDGKIIYDSEGRDLKIFDVKDGLGVYLLKKAGILTILITARSSKVIKLRAKDMEVEEIFENAEDKRKILDHILRKYRVSSKEVCFVGDDLVDLSVMKRVGLAISVRDSCPEIKKISDYITKRKGGEGAVREVCELILKAKRKWEDLVSLYS